MSGVLFVVAFLLLFIDANIRANGVVVGVIVAASVIIGDEIRIGRIGLHIGEDIVDFINGRFISAKSVKGRPYLCGCIDGTEASVCGKNGLDNGRIGRGIEVTRENIRER